MNPAAIACLAPIVRGSDAARIAVTLGTPHIANCPAEGTIIFARQPSVGVVALGVAVAEVRAEIARGSAEGVGCVCAATVQEINDFAPNIRERFVHRAGLPLVDQIAGVLGIRMAPLVTDGIVAGHAVAVIGRGAIP